MSKASLVSSAVSYTDKFLDVLIRFLRWVCTSGLAADLATTDEIATKVFEEIMAEGCKYCL